jgi:hypothetical protein
LLVTPTSVAPPEHEPPSCRPPPLRDLGPPPDPPAEAAADPPPEEPPERPPETKDLPLGPLELRFPPPFEGAGRAAAEPPPFTWGTAPAPTPAWPAPCCANTALTSRSGTRVPHADASRTSTRTQAPTVTRRLGPMGDRALSRPDHTRSGLTPGDYPYGPAGMQLRDRVVSRLVFRIGPGRRTSGPACWPGTGPPRPGASPRGTLDPARAPGTGSGRTWGRSSGA